MTSTTLPTILAGLTGLGAGPLLVATAARRTRQQPTPISVPDERTTIAGALQHPDLLPELSALSPHDFTGPHRPALWAAITEQVPTGGNTLATHLDDPTEDELAASCNTHPNLSATDLAAAAQTVADAADQRTRYQGRAPLTFDTDPPTYQPPPPTPTRTGTISLLLGTAAATTTWLLGGTARPLELVAMLTLIATLTIISLVDLDTLLIDVPTLLLGTAAPLAILTLHHTINGTTATLTTAIVATTLLGVALWLTDLAYRHVRGHSGLGGGDQLLLPAAVAIPTIVSGDILLIPLSLVAAGILALTTTVTRAAAGRTGFRQPLAFGPYLTTGWLAGWLALELTSRWT